MRRLCLLLLLLLVLDACGQKGPLYLPDDQKRDRADKTSNK